MGFVPADGTCCILGCTIRLHTDTVHLQKEFTYIIESRPSMALELESYVSIFITVDSLLLLLWDF